MKDILVNNTYRVDCKIGSGSHGVVYTGTDLRTNEKVAMKLGYRGSDYGHVENEAAMYGELGRAVGIPLLLFRGNESQYYVLVQELLGPSLQDLLYYCDGRFTLKTVLMIADQAITRIEHIHSRGCLHCDIAPQNLCIGSGNNGNTLYVIDFSLLEVCFNGEIQRHWSDKGTRGTARFATLNSHNRRELTWSDDLEALGYTLIYLLKGKLPWQGLTVETKKEHDKMIGDMKANLPVEELCKGIPDEFVAYVRYTRTLKFGTKPDYAYLRRLFRRLSQREGFKHDHVYDWTEKRFYELQKQASTATPPESDSPSQGGEQDTQEEEKVL